MFVILKVRSVIFKLFCNFCFRQILPISFPQFNTSMDFMLLECTGPKVIGNALLSESIKIVQAIIGGRILIPVRNGKFFFYFHHIYTILAVEFLKQLLNNLLTNWNWPETEDIFSRSCILTRCFIYLYILFKIISKQHIMSTVAGKLIMAFYETFIYLCLINY